MFCFIWDSKLEIDGMKGRKENFPIVRKVLHSNGVANPWEMSFEVFYYITFRMEFDFVC